MDFAIFADSKQVFEKKWNHFDEKFYWAYPIYSLDNYLKLLNLIDFYFCAIKQAQTSVIILLCIIF